MLRMKLFLVYCLIKISFGKDLNINVEHANVAVTKLIELNEKLTVLNIISNKTDGFYIVQLHTYDYPLVLSQTNPIEKGKSISGTNIGLYLPYDDLNTLYIFTTQNCTALLAITSYDIDDPIPGGCNLAFQNEIAPYMKVYDSGSTFSVEYQMPSIINGLCETNHVEAQVFYHYLPAWDFSEKSYFDAIKMMLLPQNISANAYQIPKALRSPHTRRSFNYYKGMVTVYGIIAKYGNKTSAYVPAVSFACDMIEDHVCKDEPGLLWNIMVPMALFIGIFLYSNTFFYSLNYLTHFLTASLTMFIMVFIMLGNASPLIALLIAGLVAFLFGLLWIYCWISYCYKPYVSAWANYATLGSIVALVLLNFTQSSNIAFLTDLIIESLNYWIIFTVTIVIVCIIFAPFHPRADYMAAMIIGSFIVVLASSYYYGAFVHYILIDFVRRITVDNFKYAIINLPFERGDLYLSTMWIILLFLGYRVLRKRSRRNGYESF